MLLTLQNLGALQHLYKRFALLEGAERRDKNGTCYASIEWYLFYFWCTERAETVEENIKFENRSVFGCMCTPILKSTGFIYGIYLVPLYAQVSLMFRQGPFFHSILNIGHNFYTYCVRRFLPNGSIARENEKDCKSIAIMYDRISYRLKTSIRWYQSWLTKIN